MVVDTLARPPEPWPNESRPQYQSSPYYAPAHRDHGPPTHLPPPSTLAGAQPMLPGHRHSGSLGSNGVPQQPPAPVNAFHAAEALPPMADPRFHPSVSPTQLSPAHGLNPTLPHAQPLAPFEAARYEYPPSPSVGGFPPGEVAPSHWGPAPVPVPVKPEPRSADPLRISSLVQNNAGSSQSSHPPTPATMGKENGRLPVPSYYRMIIRQQPVAARSCGFGERDRRVIDPPPILQVFYEDPNLSEKERMEVLQERSSIMTCTIWDETGQQDCSNMPDEYRQQRRLMGSSVSASFTGDDEFGKKGCFYCFPDISCRTNGNFRLKFSLVTLNLTIGVTGTRSPVVATAMTDVFTVYTAKDFPGMQASSALTKKLKKQGCLISIKKGNDRGNAGRDDSDYDDDEEEDYGEERQKPQKKKRKA